MNNIDPSTRAVLEALNGRLAAVAERRADLAERMSRLEAELVDLRAAAERCAEEAIQVEGLIRFYEPRAQATPTSSQAATAEALELSTYARPAEAGVADANAVEGSASNSEPAPPRRGIGLPQWTAAWREETAKTLREGGVPLHYKELYRAIAARGFTFGGRTPEATFLASLNRDTVTFTGVGRGCYWLAGEPLPNGVEPARPARRVRRPRPIGHRGAA